MKVTYNWLKEFVPLTQTPTEIADLLARLGFEVASVQPLGGALQGVVTAFVREVQKHPNADRLSLCKVTDGQQEFSIVCGAANVRAGIHVPLARIGAILPDGHAVGLAKLRGVESQGMICSAAELGLEEKSDGILILGDTPLGADVRPILGLDDTLIEIEVTPNRRDALSVLGIARELAAGLNLALKAPEPRVREIDPNNGFAVQIEAPELCPRYMGRLIRDIKVAPSPVWLGNRLKQCGFRPINNIVDITNYVMLELGQPLHAFDTAKLKGRAITVRGASENEPFTTLDGKTIALPAGMLVIADEQNPVALAGIMGGLHSGIVDDTKEIFLESAAFDPGHIRRNSKRLGISSESSYRFERGTDWDMVAMASVRAGQLIQELAGGMGFKPADAAPRPVPPTVIKLRINRLPLYIGIELKEAAVADRLRRLGCIINTAAGQLVVTVPSWRLDLVTEADLMEEIARLYGYENILSRTPLIRATAVEEDTLWSFERGAIRAFGGLGFLEAMNTSFMPPATESSFVPGLGQPSGAKAVSIANPLSQDVALLRTSLLPGLLQNAVLNFHRQAVAVSLVEAGRSFYRDTAGPHEQRHLAILRAGQARPPHWRQKLQKTDYSDIWGILTAFLATLHIPQVELAPALPAGRPGIHAVFHPKRSATLLSSSTVLGWFGELHPALRDAYDLREPVTLAEFDLQALWNACPSSLKNRSLSAFPPVHRDLSIVASEDAAFENILKSIQLAGGDLLESVSLIDLYRGATIGAGKKSLTFSFVFRHPARTLTDAEIEKQMQKIISELEKKQGAALRK